MTAVQAQGTTLSAMATHERISYRIVEILERSKQLAILNAITAAVGQSLDIDHIATKAIQRMLELLGFDAGGLYLLDESTNELLLKQYHGVPQSMLENLNKIPVGEGFLGRVAEAEEPLIAHFTSLDSRHARNHIPREGFQLFVGIPLRAKGRTLGVMSLASKKPRELDSEASEFFSFIGDIIGRALENARIHQQVTDLLERERRRATQLRQLSQMNRTFSSSLSQAGLLTEISRLLHESLGYSMVSIFTVDESAEELALAAIQGRFSRRAPIGYRQSIYQGISGWVARHGEPLLVNDVAKEPRFIRSSPETKSELVVPVKLDGKLMAVICVESEKPYAFSEDDLSSLQIVASQAAIGFQTIQLVEENMKQLDRLRDSEQTYRMIAENFGEGILLLHEGRICYANRKAIEITGYSVQELCALPSFLDLIDENDKDLALVNYERQLKHEPVPPYELIIVRKDGSLTTVSIGSSPIENDGGTQIQISLRDVVEQELEREQVLQSEKLAAIAQFVSGVAHELNNPLTSVVGYSELILGEGDLSEEVRHDLETIANQAHRARKIIQNLLAFACWYKPEKIEVDVNDLIEATLSLRNHHHRINNIEVIKSLAPTLPRIMADRNQLQQVFLNVIINAEQAMEETRRRGTLYVRSRLKQPAMEADQSDAIEICFTDDGAGISPENVRRIFDPFFTTKPPGVGTGLGLSISYGIIKEHGGKIYAISKEGQGATFVIELPISVAPSAGGFIPERDYSSSRERL